MRIFRNASGGTRTVWMIVLFFAILSAITLPVIILSGELHFPVTMFHQALILITVNVTCQLIIKRNISELTGQFDLYFLKGFFNGSLLGTALMIVPAVFLYALSLVAWNGGTLNSEAMLPVILTVFFGAVAEEFLFRGFLFQSSRGFTKM